MVPNVQLVTCIAAGIIFAVGLFGLLTHRDMINICISMSVMESSLVIVLAALAWVPGGAAPIMDGPFVDLPAEAFVDPLPHALALTAIVIGAGLLAVALALSVVLYQRFGTTDLSRIFRELHRQEG
ncbi:Membrane bound protein complex subunit mbxG [Alkalispirochaeta americana]|uniref:Membrane bound protein complex subunit mbxG n=1 Tax=Alkalispirochaeta americana TaxID=159291 RepID=A0A1N6TFL8_9SPIO|nr:cation:proton antiporter subunit C [Alkalispirochaeta americana]SIQ52123.1 Membrane bound protein complex subunit mbxG [Alkalispirochaeta americana]